MTVPPPLTGVNGPALNRHQNGYLRFLCVFGPFHHAVFSSLHLRQLSAQREKCGNSAHFMAMLEQLRRDFRTGSKKYLKTIFRRLVDTETWSAVRDDLQSRG